MKPVGQLRPSQLIFTFGVGALTDLPSLSVIIMGLDEWPQHEWLKITEERLLAAVRTMLGTQVESLKLPPADWDADGFQPSIPGLGVPVAAFPRWLRCPRCGAMGTVDLGIFELREDRFRPELTCYVHAACQRADGPRAIAMRFLRACRGGYRRRAADGGRHARARYQRRHPQSASTEFAGGTFSIEIASEASADMLRVMGAAGLSANTALSLSSLGCYDPVGGESWTIIDNDGADPFALGSFRFTSAGNPIEPLTPFIMGGESYSLDYAGGTGNDVVLSVVPEPSSLLLLGGGFALLGGRRRPLKFIAGSNPAATTKV